MNIQKVKDFNELVIKKEKLEAELERVKLDMAILNLELQEEFATDGIDKIKVDGRTVFPHGMIWAKYGKGNTARVIEALKKCPETKDLIKEGFNAQRLSSYVREKVKEWEKLPEDKRPASPLPPELDGIVTWSEKITIKSTAVSG